MKLFYSICLIFFLATTSLVAQTPEITVITRMIDIYSREDHDWGSREEYRCNYSIDNQTVCVWAENVESERWESFRSNENIKVLPGNHGSFSFGISVWEEDGGEQCRIDNGGDSDSHHGLTFFPRFADLTPRMDNYFNRVINNSADRTKGYEVTYNIYWFSNTLGQPALRNTSDREVCFSDDLVLRTSVHGMASTLSPSYRWEVFDVDTNVATYFTTSTNEFDLRQYVTTNPPASRRLRVSVATFSRGMQASEYFSLPVDITINGMPSATISNIIQPRCFGQRGEIQIASVSGASTIYDLFLVRNGVTVKDYYGLPAYTAYSFTDVDPGTYTLKVADRSGAACFQEFPNITINNAPSQLEWRGAKSDYNGFNVTCADASDGFITLAAAGGTQPYTFLHENNPVNSFDTKPTGTYSLVVRDANGCEVSVSETLVAPARLSGTTIQATPVSCRNSSTPDGTVTVNGTVGGVSPYQYQLNGGAWQTSNVFGSLSAGSYNVTVRDRNNCTVVLSTLVTQPATTVSADVGPTSDVTCYGGTNGSMTITGKGGTAFDGGLYRYSLNNEPFSTPSLSATYTNLPAGTYTVAVRDKNGCTHNVSVLISQPEPIRAEQNITPVSCGDRNDGSIVITLSKGTAPYFYFDETSGIARPVDPVTNTVALEDLAAGNFTLKVRDAQGCSDQSGNEWLEIPYTIGTTTPLEAYSQEQDLVPATCIGRNDAGVTIHARNGTAGYSFSADGETFEEPHDPASGSFVFTNLTGGKTYTFVVKDARQCISELEVTMLQPEFPSIGDEVIICPGQSKQLEVPMEGTYTWTSDKGFFSNEKKVVLTEEATYILSVTNAQNCSVEHTFVLTMMDNPLEADLLMADNAVQGDTLIGIDLSFPQPQERIWQFDAESIQHIKSEAPYESFKFIEPGLQSITFIAKIGECADTLTHYVTVLKKDGYSGGKEPGLGAKESLVREFVSYPNPASTQFTIRIELLTPTDVTVKLIASFSSKVCFVWRGNDAADFTIPVETTGVVPGLYFLQLETSTGEKRTTRVIITN
jgi:hypothetical protein